MRDMTATRRLDQRWGRSTPLPIGFASIAALLMSTLACSSETGDGRETVMGGAATGTTATPTGSDATGGATSGGAPGAAGEQTPGGATTGAPPGSTESPGGGGASPGGTDEPGETGGSTGGTVAPGEEAPPNINTEETVAPTEVVTETGATIDCASTERPPTPLRRLTRFEYNNAVRDLLGTTLTPANAFPPDEIADGFTNNALVLTVAALHAEKYMEASEALAAEAITKLDTLLPCDAAAAGEEACARQFATEFARRAYRRTPEPEDIDVLMQAYAAGGSFERGIEVMIRAALQSPHFLYRVEFTGTEIPGIGMVRLNGYETASRLSFLLWGSIPDEALLAAAEAGELSTPAQVEARARAMLQDEKARPAVAEFYQQWLGLPRLESTGKDPVAFPLWSDDMRRAMIAENAAVVEAIVYGATPTLTALLTEPIGLPSGPLADLYGVAPSDSPVNLGADQRSGVLTLPGFLSVQAHPDQTSPVLRGKFVRAKLMCTPPPPPPPDAAVVAPPPGEGGTARERFGRHSSDPECAACHALMDPLGLTFEYYDSIGNYRTMDNDLPIDLSGEMFSSRDMDGPFVGVQELAQKLAGSDQVGDCVATQWYKYAMGRGAENGDACSLSPLQEAFAASGGNLMEMMVALTQTEAFLYRLSVDAQEVSQ